MEDTPFIDFNISKYFYIIWGNGGHDYRRWTSEEVISGGRNIGKMAKKFEYQSVIFILNLIITMV